MTEYKERLSRAIDYAVKSNWDTYNRQEILMQRVRRAKNVCAFGAGNFFKENFSWFYELDMICKYICDNNEERLKGNDIGGKKYISLEKLQEMDDVIVIISIGNYADVVKQLDELGIENYPLEYFILRTCNTEHLESQWFEENREKKINAIELLEDEISKEIYVEDICNKIAPHLAKKSYSELQNTGMTEYFKTDVFSLHDKEYFVDAGAYKGDTLEEFLNIVHGKYGKVYLFELARGNYEQLEKNCRKYEKNKIALFNAGVSDQNSTVSITGNEMGWRVSENSGSGGGVANLVKMDDILKNEKVTFVKMDIEGSEMRALQGSYEIISTQLPKLAICTYHLLSDIWEIPMLIKKMNDKYKIYLRHHSQTVWDTVCYAYVPSR